MPISNIQLRAQQAAADTLVYLMRRAEDDEADVPPDVKAWQEADLARTCAAQYDDKRFGLRIGAIFVILVTSILGTTLPIILRNNRFVPRPFFDFAKYFGSGVILATGFCHLLLPAYFELNSPCLSGGWTSYQWAPAICLMAVFAIMYTEAAAYRLGSKYLLKYGVDYSMHGGHPIDPPPVEAGSNDPNPKLGNGSDTDVEAARNVLPNSANEKSDFVDSDSVAPSEAEAVAQLLGVIVLEFGVVFHSVIIGLTLATTDEFTILFIVIIFHQMFEGLGLGSRLAGLYLPASAWWTRYLGAFLYSICTPIGMAVGLGVRKSFNGHGATFNAVSGTLDAISAGVLLYTGFVELIAHEIILNPKLMKGSSIKLGYVFVCMGVGAGLMALLGKWA